MSSAPNYTPTASFANDETNTVSGRSTVKTVSLDTELANVSSSINYLNDNLKLIQRDDGNIRDNLIKPFSLSSETRALLAAGGKPKGPWATATAYAVGDMVTSGSIAYICYTAHTSSGAIDTNKFMAVASGIYSSPSAFIETLLNDATQSEAQITLGVDSGTTANKMVRLNGSSQIPAVDGSLLTNIGTGANQLVKLNGSAQLPAVDGTNLVFSNVNLSHASNPHIRFNNTDTTITSGDTYGALEFYGNDASLNASGLRAQIIAKSGDSAGGAEFVFQTANQSSTVLGQTMRLNRLGIELTADTAGSITASCSSVGLIVNSSSIMALAPTVRVGNTKRQLGERVSLVSTDATLDVDLSSYFDLTDVKAAKLVRVTVIGQYNDVYPTGATFAGSARLFKSWEQIVMFNGTTMALIGAALIGTAYNSDAVNFPAGAVNANNALLVAGTSSVVLRIKNRTAAAVGSQTNFDYSIEIIAL